jgi:NitT/TauT family transport system substrate-binding protein
MLRPAAALTLVLTMTTAACGNTSAGGPAGVDRVTVGAIPIVDVAPLYLGRQKGFFDQQRIKLSIVPTTGGGASIPAVVSGSFTFSFSNVTSLLIARDQGIDLKVVANGNNSTGKPGEDFAAVMVRKDSPIKTAKDLAGKTVSGNNLRNVCDGTIRQVVRDDGGDPTTIKWVEVPFPDAPAALQERRVDASCVVEPFVTAAKAQGGRPVAWNFAQFTPNLTVATYFTTAQVVARQPDLVRRFTAAINQSLAYAQAHPDEAREILTTYTKIPPPVIAKITLPSWPRSVNRQSVEATAERALDDGLLRNKADISALFAASAK